MKYYEMQFGVILSVSARKIDALRIVRVGLDSFTC